MVYRILFILSLVVHTTLSAAQQHSDAYYASRDYIPVDFKGNLPEELFVTDFVVIQSIEFEGNNSTRKHILLRELIFSPGDTLMRADLESALEKSRENLLNTSLFNFVNVSLLMYDFLPLANVRFTFVERWYIWPVPIFEIAERNLNDWLLSPNLKRTNYGAFIVKENFRGRMERISILARAGYRQIYNVGYSVPYINKKQRLGLSFTVGYNRRNEIEFMTRDNIQLFYSEPDGFALSQFYATTQLFYRKGIHTRHSFLFEYNQIRFSDSLLVLNPLFSPGSATIAPFFAIGYDFRYDHRDARAYPLRGHYYDLRIRKQGLGILKDEKMDLTTAETSLRKFWQLDNRWYYGSGINAKMTFGNFKPYYLQRGLGFRGDIVRGYENFVIDGQHFAVLKNNLKYALVPSRTSRLGFIPTERFSLIHYALYLNAFVDIGYVRDNMFFQDNPYSNNFLTGYGLGLDLVTYYDKVFRTEFSFTRHGSMGVYFHLIAPI